MVQVNEQMSSPASSFQSYGAVGGNEPLYTQIGSSEASIPSPYASNRALIYSPPGHVPRSSSHDQLSRAYQSNYYGYHSPPGMTSSPSTIYSSPNSMPYPHQPPPPIQHQQSTVLSQQQVSFPGSLGKPPHRGGSGRPMPVYSSWSSQPNIIQPQDQSINVHENETSPVTSSGSSNDSLPVVIPSPSPSPSVSSTLYSGMNGGGGRAMNPGFVTGTGRTVRALYNCVGENSTELSFEPNAIIYNGKLSAPSLISSPFLSPFITSLFSSSFLLFLLPSPPLSLFSVRRSKEPGWLEGSYNGRTGLIPENYVQFI